METCRLVLLFVVLARVVTCLHTQTTGGMQGSPVWRALMLNKKQQEEQMDAAPPCARCGARRAAAEASLSEPQLTSLRVELIKQQILQKLRLSEPPNVTIPQGIIPGLLVNPSVLQQIPKHVHDINNDADDFYGNTDQVILFPKQEATLCSSTSVCFSLAMPKDLQASGQVEVSGAMLWLYAEAAENTTLEVALQDGESPLATLLAPRESGWIKIALPHDIVTQWLETKKDGSYQTEAQHVNIRVSWNDAPRFVTTSTDRNVMISLHPQHRPFLGIRTRPQHMSRRRTKRNVNCTPGIRECCRENLHVSFQEIGWSDWIIHPKGYDAYFCRGSCTTATALTQSSSYYTSVLQRFIHQQQSRGQQQRKLDLAPCCTPTKLAPLQLIYLDSNMVAMQKTLPNMVVEACGCL